MLLFLLYFLALQKANFLGDSRKKSTKRQHAIFAFFLVFVTFLFVPQSVFEVSLLMIRNFGLALVFIVIFIVFELLIGFALNEFPRKITWKSIIVSLIATSIVVSSGFASLMFQPLSFDVNGFSSIYLTIIVLILFLTIAMLAS